MKSISIEYCHIYTNDKIQEEHHKSLEVLGKLKAELLNASLDLVVMVDDYSFPDPSFDYGQHYKWMASNGFAPDKIIRESQLIPVCDEVLSLITDETIKAPIIDYIKAKKYPCSLFIAAWYLIRLGYIKSEIFESEHCANKLINILPASYRSFEDKGLELIAATPFSHAVNKIDYIFFDGRLIA